MANSSGDGGRARVWEPMESADDLGELAVLDRVFDHLALGGPPTSGR